jgi:hypothetical protein
MCPVYPCILPSTPDFLGEITNGVSLAALTAKKLPAHLECLRSTTRAASQTNFGDDKDKLAPFDYPNHVWH